MKEQPEGHNPSTHWLLRRARLADNQPLQDVLIRKGRIARIAAELPTYTDDARQWDLAGRVLLPGLVDLHTHLDKTYSTLENQSGTLLEAIAVWGRFKQQRTQPELATVVRRALCTAIANGVTGLRSHIDISDASDLATVETLLTLRREFSDRIDLQFVALGQPGQSAARDAAMLDALQMGIDFVGGAPALMPDPAATVEAAFALAQRTGKPLDLHIDETEDPHMLTLEQVAELTVAHARQGQVTVGHCCSLAFAAQSVADRVMDKVAAAQLNVVTLPSCNLVLMGRNMQPTPRGVTRVKELLARGVNVCAASDNVHDPFNPFGAYDPLHIANLAAHTAHMTGAPELYQCLDLVTTHPRRAFGHTTAIAPGAPADLVIVDTQRVLDAVVSLPPRLATFKAGRRVVHTTIEQVWA